MKPAISVGGRTGTAHNPTVGEWETSRSWPPSVTVELHHSWEDVSSSSLLSTNTAPKPANRSVRRRTPPCDEHELCPWAITACDESTAPSDRFPGPDRPAVRVRGERGGCHGVCPEAVCGAAPLADRPPLRVGFGPDPGVTRSRSFDSRPPRLYLSTAVCRGMSDDNGPENEPAVVTLQSREDVDWLAELRDEEPSDIETSTDADDTRRD